MIESLRGNDVFPFENCLLVIPRREPRLFLLNPTARTIWEESDQGRAPDEVVAKLAADFDVPTERVRADVDAILGEWRAHRLLVPASPPPDDGEATMRPAPGPRSFHSERVYALCGRPIRLRFEGAEVERVVHPPLAHAVTPSGEADTIDVLRDGAGYLVVCNRSDVERATNLEEALGQVFGRILELSYPEAKWLAMLHAAAVGDGEGAVVLAGDSGSGKSTLTTALVDAGLSYFSDDIVPLDDALRIRPFPLAISVKEGSWPVLAARFPELAGLPVHEGRRRRYLPVAESCAARRVGLPVKLLVFPSYGASQPAALRPLTSLEVLERLTRARSWMSLDGGLFGVTLQWIEQTPAFELGYGSLDEAVPVVQRLLNGEVNQGRPQRPDHGGNQNG